MVSNEIQWMGEGTGKRAKPKTVTLMPFWWMEEHVFFRLILVLHLSACLNVCILEQASSRGMDDDLKV